MATGPRRCALALAWALALAGWARAMVAVRCPAKGWEGREFPDTAFEGVRYVGVAFLEEALGRKGTWVPDRQKFVIPDTTGRKWYFSLDNPFALAGSAPFNLIYPVRRGPQSLYLPAQPLVQLLNRQLGLGLSLAPAERAPGGRRRLAAAGEPGPAYTVLGVTAEERDNGTLVSIATAGKLAFETYWVPPVFILKLEGGVLAPSIAPKARGLGLVKGILATQEKKLAQITLNIPKAVDTVEADYADGDDGALLITVRKAAFGRSKPRPARPRRRIKTIIIDPGHGGKDPGAQSDGVNEADVTLAVGLRLKEALRKDGFTALLTREDNHFVTLDQRPKFASAKGGDLFLSLHCNSIAGTPRRKREVNGFTAYILRAGESEEDKALARRENQAVEYESGKSGKTEISPVEWILLEHQLNLYSKESEKFAADVVEGFDGFRIPKSVTGAGQAGFYVLVGAYMPAILFEMGYLSNENDRRVLRSPEGQKEVAARLAEAVRKYAREEERSEP